MFLGEAETEILYDHVPSTYDMECLVEPLLKRMFPSPLIKNAISLLIPSCLLVMKDFLQRKEEKGMWQNPKRQTKKSYRSTQSRSQVTMKQIRRISVNDYNKVYIQAKLFYCKESKRRKDVLSTNHNDTEITHYSQRCNNIERKQIMEIWRQEQ